MTDPDRVADQTLTPLDLMEFTAVDKWYSHWLGRLAYSDGVKYFADRAEAYWFLDIVATEILPMQKQEPFISIVMEVQLERARITSTDGNGRLVYERWVDFTDCPPGTWQFYLLDSSLILPGQVLMHGSKTHIHCWHQNGTRRFMYGEPMQEEQCCFCPAKQWSKLRVNYPKPHQHGPHLPKQTA